MRDEAISSTLVSYKFIWEREIRKLFLQEKETHNNNIVENFILNPVFKGYPINYSRILLNKYSN